MRRGMSAARHNDDNVCRGCARWRRGEDAASRVRKSRGRATYADLTEGGERRCAREEVRERPRRRREEEALGAVALCVRADDRVVVERDGGGGGGDGEGEARRDVQLRRDLPLEVANGACRGPRARARESTRRGARERAWSRAWAARGRAGARGGVRGRAWAW